MTPKHQYHDEIVQSYLDRCLVATDVKSCGRHILRDSSSQDPLYVATPEELRQIEEDVEKRRR